jgi:ketosteroid isomerase-like protein
MIIRELLLVLTVAFVTGGTVACRSQARQRAGEQQVVDTVAVRGTIDSLRALWQKSVAAGDLRTMTTMLADGAVMVQPGGAAWDSLAAAGSGAPFPPGATIDITPIEVRVMSPEWAYEFGNSVVTYKPAGARQARKLTDTYLILFRKTASGWKVYREVASSKAPPKANP